MVATGTVLWLGICSLGTLARYDREKVHAWRPDRPHIQHDEGIRSATRIHELWTFSGVQLARRRIAVLVNSRCALVSDDLTCVLQSAETLQQPIMMQELDDARPRINSVRPTDVPPVRHDECRNTALGFVKAFEQNNSAQPGRRFCQRYELDVSPRFVTSLNLQPVLKLLWSALKNF